MDGTHCGTYASSDMGRIWDAQRKDRMGPHNWTVTGPMPGIHYDVPKGSRMTEDVRGERYTHCGQCGRPVVDDTTDFGNGLVMRTTCSGIEFRIGKTHPEGTLPGASWTPGISRDEMLRFLGAK